MRGNLATQSTGLHIYKFYHNITHCPDGYDLPIHASNITLFKTHVKTWSLTKDDWGILISKSVRWVLEMSKHHENESQMI